ncbi:MAG: hypothetical protein JW841_07225 [Deltaproteobacteria bacterium]|nr:hypothetical protein [Deltaproteobacteria bacterium]
MKTIRLITDIACEMDEDVFALLGRIDFHVCDNHYLDDHERLAAIAVLLREFFAKRERLRWELINHFIIK